MRTWEWETTEPGVHRTRLTEPVDPVALIEAVDARLAAGAHRVELLLDPGRRDLRAVAVRAGMRREGVLRGLLGSGPEGDALVVSRLADDPPRSSRENRLGVLDSAMPRKRVIGQGVIRDDRGRVLLCELTYKAEWDLPGGIVDPDEGPATTVVREIEEELGVELPLGPLVSLNWLPAYRGWSDALLCLFDLGVHPDLTERMTLDPGEIRAVHWCTPEDVAQHAAPYVARHLSQVWDGQELRTEAALLADGRPVPAGPTD